jgi:hypothetical protein
MQAPAIAVLWKSGDGRLCVISRRGNTLVLTLERAGVVEREQVMESPREAMDVAAKWRLLLKER